MANSDCCVVYDMSRCQEAFAVSFGLVSLAVLGLVKSATLSLELGIMQILQRRRELAQRTGKGHMPWSWSCRGQP
jgi:hypothetical protein